MNIKARDFEHIVQKFQLKTRNAGDRLAWFEYEGKIITRTRRSHGSGDLPFSDKIRTQLKLSEEEFREAVQCHLSREEYIEILRKKGYIQPSS
jgi:hypothetical protein